MLIIDDVGFNVQSQTSFFQPRLRPISYPLTSIPIGCTPKGNGVSFPVQTVFGTVPENWFSWM